MTKSPTDQKYVDLFKIHLQIEADPKFAHLRRPGIINPVPGTGNPDAHIMVIGEAPGEEENEQARPFVGTCGLLLDDIFQELKINREEDLFITNVLKYRPPGNRRPTVSEKLAAMQYISEEINVVNPRGMILLGAVAFAMFYPTFKISLYEGQVIERRGRLVFPSYHPGAVVRDPSKRKNLKAVFQQAKDRCIER